MASKPGTERLYHGEPIYEGTAVYDVTGDKLGDVSEHGIQDDRLVMHKGMFSQTDVYIPLDVIQRADSNGVYLTITSDELSDMDTKGPEDEHKDEQKDEDTDSDTEKQATGDIVVENFREPVRAEQVDVVKRPGVTEEVGVAKTPPVVGVFKSPGVAEEVDAAKSPRVTKEVDVTKTPRTTRETEIVERPD